jgi:hypothetical protein
MPARTQKPSAKPLVAADAAEWPEASSVCACVKATVAAIATPSAPPICCAVLISPDASPACCGSTPASAAIDIGMNRRPARIDDVDQHQRVVVGEVDVVGRVVGAVPGQVDPLAADLERASILKGLLVRWPGRVVVAQQEALGLLVSDARDVLVEEGGRAGVVGVVVRVDEVVDLVADAVGGGDLVDGPLDVVADRGRRVEQHDRRTSPAR